VETNLYKVYLSLGIYFIITCKNISNLKSLGGINKASHAGASEDNINNITNISTFLLKQNSQLTACHNFAASPVMVLPI
jgi:hypothetical protein